MILDSSNLNIATAVEYLNSGKLVAFPTETVYGLGADAHNAQAVAQVFTVKGRPSSHPLIIHLADAAQLAEYVQTIPESAVQLAKHFWPGPLTLILKRSAQVLDIVTGGQDTVAVRAPNHPVAQQLLQAFGRGLVAPSANRFTGLSPTKATHVQASLGDSVPLILDGGECRVGIESTIVDCTVEPVRVLRLGAISLQRLAQVLTYQPLLLSSITAPQIPRAPGMHAYHYAPHTPLYLLDNADLLPAIQQYLAHDRMITVLAHQHQPVLQHRHLNWITMPQAATEYAQRLYTQLHELDIGNYAVILVERPPITDEWFAVIDRLQKAAAKFV